MEIYKILVIGNSFGEDATHFLHDLALTRGINTKAVSYTHLDVYKRQKLSRNVGNSHCRLDFFLMSLLNLMECLIRA